ncbi:MULTISPECIES: hypothetical protein [Pseudoalteromonas]|uniref:hypothetical protein n=1 Tax=Pseudoalteromonas TaxID=53246 RepID=UPI00031C3020|nr:MULTISPECIES: hypothetical protein [Pseudoalteromonas]MCF2828712.1 hypothetical protein [Pseudoalteromonas sp. OF5H-5]MCF2834480.1 hypothetical protein [Pseudoalteromonas sp. DL2-H6]MCF2925116.1 hypothetical protein [Pseudoalteromonas sp. DL2-H1]MCG7554081.1 hypothetical protein [Pseudoalteromonas sp. Of11M-6]
MNTLSMGQVQQVNGGFAFLFIPVALTWGNVATAAAIGTAGGAITGGLLAIYS